MGKKKEKNKKKKKNKKNNNKENPAKIKMKDNDKTPYSLYEVKADEIKNLESAIEDDYFDFKRDTLDLYENNIIEDDKLNLDIEDKEEVLINEDFYQNIPLNQIQGIKKLLADIKTLNCNSINYDFIKNKVLIDENINNYDEYINSNKDNEEIEDSNDEKSETSKNEEELVSENELKIKEKINPLFISYERKYSKDNKLWWPFKLFYGGKKYYPNSNEKYLSNKNTTIINYCCVNHRINTANKKLLFGIYRCNGKIEFNRITEEFFLVRNHNKICD